MAKFSKYAEIASKVIMEYVSQKFSIKDKAHDLKVAITKALYALKREFIKTIVETALLITAILALIAGTIILLSRIVAIEYVLIGYGLLVLIFLMMYMKLK